MFKKQLHTRQAIRFRAFSRKRYAAFRSMHREVTLGHVASYICDLELAKSGKQTERQYRRAASVPASTDDTVPNEPEYVANLLSLAEILSLQTDYVCAAAAQAIHYPTIRTGLAILQRISHSRFFIPFLFYEKNNFYAMYRTGMFASPGH